MHLFFVLCDMSLDVTLALFALFSSFLVGLKTDFFFFYLFFIVVFVVKEITIFHRETQRCVAKFVFGGGRWTVYASLLQMSALMHCY